MGPARQDKEIAHGTGREQGERGGPPPLFSRFCQAASQNLHIWRKKLYTSPAPFVKAPRRMHKSPMIPEKSPLVKICVYASAHLRTRACTHMHTISPTAFCQGIPPNAQKPRCVGKVEEKKFLTAGARGRYYSISRKGKGPKDYKPRRRGIGAALWLPPPTLSPTPA